MARLILLKMLGCRGRVRRRFVKRRPPCAGRYNQGFDKLQIVKDLGFSEAVYGFGVGIVYLGCMLLEIPSNLLLDMRFLEKTIRQLLHLAPFRTQAAIALSKSFVLDIAI